LELDVVGQALDSDEPLPRDVLLSLKKLQGEGQQAELKIVLGSELNSWSLTIALSYVKFEIWFQDIHRFLDSSYAPTKALKTLVIRLENMSCIIPHVCHSLWRIRKVIIPVCQSPQARHKTSAPLCAGFALAQRFFRKARDGINMNLLTHRSPNIWLHSDTCKHGIWGVNVKKATGWRWLILEEWRLKLTLNTLEFLAAVVGIWVEIL
jgi:hypothetical protein